MSRVISVFKETKDEWYGSYGLDGREKMLVEVSLRKLRLDEFNHFGFRVCVWGNDDLGMERDFEVESESLEIFLKVISLDTVNFSDLKSMGFIQA